ncbi:MULTISPECIES: SagB/ThcOx family dehydrogenase [unclassified Streptomyces]|uniref:SagB/ThcOx family dehydrogenase n=1 Tax=unclassified Streptomyces TaxID=2593676 RepID=UPI0038227494
MTTNQLAQHPMASGGDEPAATTATVPSAVRRNPLLRIRFDDGIQADVLLSGRTVQLPHGRFVTALSLLSGTTSTWEAVETIAHALCDGDVDAALDLLSELLAADLVVDAAREFPSMAAVQHWIDRGWLDALVFHLRCGAVAFDDDGVDDVEQEQNRLLSTIVEAGVPDLWKAYPGTDCVALPEAQDRAELPPLETVLLRRRSNRPWRRERISLTDVATILRLAGEELTTIRRKVEGVLHEQPSALLHSAFTALEIYVVAHAVDGLEPGLYHYAPDRQVLESVRPGEMRDEMQRMCVGQQRAGSGAASFIVTGMWERYMYRYRYPHAYRTLLVNSAELAQKLILLATAVELNTFVTPAFDDAYADELLGLDPLQEVAIEVVTVG